ncbi:MAG: hypothetical protein MI747_08830 [Desulfobacterales bacterium]|nr:hypothetical protein [Desulfobacterales bacterium]
MCIQIKNQNGSIIVTILAILIMASLGLGISLMFQSSNIQSVETNLGLRATNLAEAGFRYAGGIYRNAGNLSAKFDRLQAMDQEEVTLLNNSGSFQLSTFPYWFLADNDQTEVTTLKLRTAGKLSDAFENALPSNGMVYIADEFYSYNSGSVTPGAGKFNPDGFTITLDGGDSVTLDDNDSIYLAFTPTSSVQVNENGNFILFSNAAWADLLPQRNGLIGLYSNEQTFEGSFRYKDITILANDSVQLNGITLEADGSFPVQLDTNSRVVLKKQLLLGSVGQIGTGSHQALKSLDFNVYLTDEIEFPADAPQAIDFGGPGKHTPEIFPDKDKTKLEHWDFDNSQGLAEPQLITTSTLGVSTAFTEKAEYKNVRTNYVTFQNFSEVDQDKGYTMELVDKARLPQSVRNINFNGIWGNASDNIYFVGDNGTILHFDGQEFKISEIGFSINGDNLNAIWGTPSEKSSSNQTDYIFVVGDDGRTLINEGNGWKHASHSESYDIFAAHGTSWGHFDGYGEAGTNPYNWDSATTAHELENYTWYQSAFDNEINFKCLWATHHSYPWSGRGGVRKDQNIMVGHFSGSDYGYYENGDGLIFHEFYAPPVIIKDTKLRGIWGSSWNDIYAVGDGGSIYQNTAGDVSPESWRDSWVKIPSTAIPTSENLNGVYGNHATDFYVIGDNGTVLYNKGDGFEIVPTNGVTSENLNSIWGSDRTGIYAVGDNGTIVFLGYPVNKIGGHVLPLAKNDELKKKWANTEKYLSYTIQAKTVWGDELEYAASGINFRWHEEIPGKYAGYGISFLRHDPSDDADSVSGDYNDMIPDDLKPFFKGIKEKDDKLLIVLWEQYVQGGAEQRRWIAFKDISEDMKMLKSNGTPVDHASLVVKVHEKSIDGVKTNDINVYYGNASMNNQSYDAEYNNTTRNYYNATFGKKSLNIKWPFSIEKWTHCGSNNSCKNRDRFTLVDNVSVASQPAPATPAVKYWIVNPAADSVILRNGFTIRTGRFTSPKGTEFGSQSQRSEIGLHVFGDIGDHGTQRLVSFTDFAVQLGVKSDGEDSQSSFGSLQ